MLLMEFLTQLSSYFTPLTSRASGPHSSFLSYIHSGINCFKKTLDPDNYIYGQMQLEGREWFHIRGDFSVGRREKMILYADERGNKSMQTRYLTHCLRKNVVKI